MSKRKPTNKELSTRFVTAENFIELANSGTTQPLKREDSGGCLKRELEEVEQKLFANEDDLFLEQVSGKVKIDLRPASTALL